MVFKLMQNREKPQRSETFFWSSCVDKFKNTPRCSIYGLKNEQILNFHIISLQILTSKASKLFLGWLPIQCNGAPKKVAKVNI